LLHYRLAKSSSCSEIKHKCQDFGHPNKSTNKISREKEEHTNIIDSHKKGEEH